MSGVWRVLPEERLDSIQARRDASHRAINPEERDGNYEIKKSITDCNNEVGQKFGDICNPHASILQGCELPID